MHFCKRWVYVIIVVFVHCFGSRCKIVSNVFNHLWNQLQARQGPDPKTSVQFYSRYAYAQAGYEGFGHNLSSACSAFCSSYVTELMSAQNGHRFGHNFSSACSAFCSSYVTELMSAQNGRRFGHNFSSACSAYFKIIENTSFWAPSKNTRISYVLLCDCAPKH